MATHEIFEGRLIKLRVRVAKGKNKAEDAEFVVLKDGEEWKREKAAFKGTLAHFPDFNADAVAEDADAYLLEYWVETGGEKCYGKDDIRVWRKTITVKATKDEDDQPCPKFPFTITLPDGTTEEASTRNDGTYQIRLRDAGKVDISVDPPWEVTEWTKKKGPTRELKVKCNFEAEFFAPRPGNDPTKQFVNLSSAANDGRDGKGSLIVFEVGAKGDQSRQASQRHGKQGDEVHVKVTFGGESKRSQPKKILRTPGSSPTDSNEGKDWEGKVTLDAQGKATFTVDLGLAGGDTCTVKIGTTEECADEEIKFVNWRRLYYEILAPDFMGLEAVAAHDGTNTQDFPANLRSRIKTYADDCFFEYVIHRGTVFPRGDAPANTVFDDAYFGGGGGNPVYVLTDHTFTLYPRAFDRGMAPRCAYLKPCMRTYYSPGLKTKETTANTARHVYVLPKDYFLEFSAEDGARAIQRIIWETKLPANQELLKARPVVAYQALRGAPLGGSRTATVRVEDAESGRTADLTFPWGGDAVGRPRKSLTSGLKTQVRTYLAAVFAPASLRANAMKVSFRVVGPSGGAADDTRIRNVCDFVRAEVNANHRGKIFYHAALDFSAGLSTRGGNLDPAVAVELIDHDEFAIVLPSANPTDPGNWVGAFASADVAAGTTGKCEVKLTIQYEPARSSLGLAGDGPQAGENLFVWKEASPNCSGDTLMHELAHSMGLTVMRGWNKAPPGLGYPKTVDENDPDTGNKGHVYDNAHGGSGSHCANGLSDGQKSGSDYDSSWANCGMLDNGPSTDPSPFNGFCDQCQEYIKARDISDITRSFK